MLSSIYIFLGVVALVLFFLAVYDWGATGLKVAGLPALCSAVLNIMLCAFSWNVKTISGATEFTALESWECHAMSLFWFLLGMISIILAIVIYLEKPKELVDEYNIRL